ncbi:MAG: hypothetical protein N2651_03245, partial [Fimbriimonadales bacterium]|nr:hypothetical protein [Fimbriimonadales bacterium]
MDSEDLKPEKLLEWLLQREADNPADSRRRDELLINGKLLAVLRLLPQHLDDDTAEALREAVRSGDFSTFPALRALCERGHSSYLACECDCPLCGGENGVHYPRLIRLALAAALAYWDRNNANGWLRQAFNTIFGRHADIRCKFGDPILLSIPENAPDAPLAPLAILGDILYQLGSGAPLAQPVRASLVLVVSGAQGGGRTPFPAQVGVAHSPVDLPPVFYPAPELLLASTYDLSFAQQLGWAWTYASNARGAEPPAVRWRVFNYREAQWVGKRLEGASAGAAFYVALRSLLTNGPAPNFRYTISASLTENGKLASVAEVDAKVRAWRNSILRDAHTPQLQEGFRFYVHSDNFEEAHRSTDIPELVHAVDDLNAAYNALTRLNETVEQVLVQVALRYNQLPLGDELRLLPLHEVLPESTRQRVFSRQAPEPPAAGSVPPAARGEPTGGGQSPEPPAASSVPLAQRGEPTGGGQTSEPPPAGSPYSVGGTESEDGGQSPEPPPAGSPYSVGGTELGEGRAVFVELPILQRVKRTPEAATRQSQQEQQPNQPRAPAPVDLSLIHI